MLLMRTSQKLSLDKMLNFRYEGPTETSLGVRLIEKDFPVKHNDMDCQSAEPVPARLPASLLSMVGFTT